ncbi:MAG: AI-2E family transporter [Mycobacteriales bacterium]|nr:AI-2E family transporter [Frankia sp.]
MAVGTRGTTPPRLRVTGRSIVLTVVLFALTAAALRLVAAAGRVIGWMLVAAALAALATPLVERLSRRLPRGLAAAIVVAVGLILAAVVARALVTDVARETKRLQRSAPDVARRLEESDRFGSAARAVNLEARTKTFVDKVPDLLTGPGTRTQKVRAAATRGVATLTTTVLTLFLLLHGPRLARAAIAQIRNATTRQRIERAVRAGYERGVGYAAGSLAMAAVAGSVAYAAAWSAHVPGAGALAVWVAMWDIVPILGAVLGAAPIVIIGAVASPWRGAALAALFVLYQVAELLFLQRPLERRTVRVGPFATLAAALIGLEVRGISGALLAVLAVAVTAALVDQLTDPATG